MESIWEQNLHANLHTSADLEQGKKKEAWCEKEGDREERENIKKL